MGAEDFAAARRDDALTGQPAITIVVMMTPSFVIIRPNAGVERADPYANVLGGGRRHHGKRCNCRARPTSLEMVTRVSNGIHICEVGRPFVHANLRKTQKLTGGCMGIVMIRCPTTGRAISTRIAADRESSTRHRCSTRRRFARSAAPTTSGLQRKLGFTSLVSHPKKLPCDAVHLSVNISIDFPP
jgi:hypothetical protein